MKSLWMALMCVAVSAWSAKPVVVVTDCGNWVDDQLAIVYLLASPSVEVKGIVASHYGAPGTAKLAKEAVTKLLADLGSQVPVWQGAEVSLAEKPDQPASEGALQIATLAKQGRLDVLCFSAATDVAQALKEGAAAKAQVYWVGGGPLPKGGRGDFNLANDVRAAQMLFESPVTLYWMPAVGVADAIKLTGTEVRERFADYGTPGKLLKEVAATMGRSPASLWDLSLAGVYVRPGLGITETKPAPEITEDFRLVERKRGKDVVVFTRVRVEPVLHDFENALKAWAKRERDR
ncbi:MAG: nucleoside hydrolase [Fimbriimonadia bacterium]|jgi:inosine-uridine nucleoside N-ribohydrolase